MVFLGADVRRLPRPRAGRGRPGLLPGAALRAGWHAQCDPDPAPEGQARRSQQCQFRGRVPRRAGLAGRRGRAGHRDDPADGGADAARLPDRVRQPDAPGAGAGAASCAASPRVRQGARLAAPDAQRPGRPRAGIRSGDGAGVPRRARGGCRPARCRGSRVGPPGHRAGQILGVQARASLRQRGTGMPRRRRLRRRVRAAAPVPAGAAEFDLGRQWQHPVPGCVARADARAGQPRGVLRRTRACARWPCPAGCRNRPPAR